MAELLGHTQVRTSARYAHLAAGLVKAAAQAAEPKWALPEYRCNLIANILFPANVEGRYLAKMASTWAFHDCRRWLGDGDLVR